MDGPRYPSGDLKPQNETPVGELSRARRAYLAGLRMNKLFENELGFLHLSGVLTEAQRLAGEEFGLLAIKYRRIVLDGARSHAKISKPEGIGGRSESEEYDQALIDKITADYAQASALAGKQLDCLLRLCVDGELLAWWEQQEIKPPLDRLAAYFRVENKIRTLS